MHDSHNSMQRPAGATPVSWDQVLTILNDAYEMHYDGHRKIYITMDAPAAQEFHAGGKEYITADPDLSTVTTWWQGTLEPDIIIVFDSNRPWPIHLIPAEAVASIEGSDD